MVVEVKGNRDPCNTHSISSLHGWQIASWGAHMQLDTVMDGCNAASNATVCAFLLAFLLIWSLRLVKLNPECVHSLRVDLLLWLFLSRTCFEGTQLYLRDVAALTVCAAL